MSTRDMIALSEMIENNIDICCFNLKDRWKISSVREQAGNLGNMNAFTIVNSVATCELRLLIRHDILDYMPRTHVFHKFAKR